MDTERSKIDDWADKINDYINDPSFGEDKGWKEFSAFVQFIPLEDQPLYTNAEMINGLGLFAKYISDKMFIDFDIENMIEEFLDSLPDE